MASRKLQREDENSQFTWRAPSGLAGRLEVPIAGAWNRLSAGPKRRNMLENALSSEAVSQGALIAVVGPAMSGKSQVGLALADLRGLRAVFATDQSDQQAFKPQGDMLVLIDPVSAYPPEDVKACIDFYRGKCPMILVDREEEAFAGIEGIHSIIRLRLPSPGAVSSYLKELFHDYPHGLTEADFEQLGAAMSGLSLPQVNQVAVDAALSRLQYSQAVDRRALDSALAAHGMMRSQMQGE